MGNRHSKRLIGDRQRCHFTALSSVTMTPQVGAAQGRGELSARFQATTPSIEAMSRDVHMPDAYRQAAAITPSKRFISSIDCRNTDEVLSNTLLIATADW